MVREADQLQILRKNAGFRTRRRAAEFLGVTENTVYRWETGRAEIPAHAPKLLQLYSELRVLQSTISASQAAAANGIDQLLRKVFREMRQSSGQSQSSLAKKAHVSRSWVAHFERHGDIPNDDSLTSALEVLGLDVDGILLSVPNIGRVLVQLEGRSIRTLFALLIASNLINEIPYKKEQEPTRRSRPRQLQRPLLLV